MRQIKEVCKNCMNEAEYTKSDIIENTISVHCKHCGEQFIVNNYTDYIETESGDNVVDKMLEATLLPQEVDGYQFNPKTSQYEMKFSWGVSYVIVEIKRKTNELSVVFSDNWTDTDKVRFQKHLENRIIKRYEKIMEDFNDGLQKRNQQLSQETV